MSRHDSPKIHRIPSWSHEGRRLIHEGKVVNRKPELKGVECLEIILDDARILSSKLTQHTNAETDHHLD